MRYLILLTAAQSPSNPPPELMDAIMKLGAEATNAGALLDTAGLAPSSAGARVGYLWGRLTVTDGPFTETKELTGGFALVEVKSREEAIEWAKRFRKIVGDGDSMIQEVFGG